MIYSPSFFNSWIYNLLLIHPVQRFPRLSSSFPCTLPGLLLPSMLLSLSASLWGLFSLGISVWAPKGHFQTSSELQGVGFPKRARVRLPEATSRGGKGACEIPPQCPVSSLPQVELLFILSLGMRCFPISVNPVPSVFWGLCNPGWILGYLQH